MLIFKHCEQICASSSQTFRLSSEMRAYACTQVFLWSLLTGENKWNHFVEKGTAVNAMVWDRNLLFCAADMNVKVRMACLLHAYLRPSSARSLVTAVVMPWSRDIYIYIYIYIYLRCSRNEISF
jgi:hypothetical protein